MSNPVTWFEIMGKDAAALHKFYRDVFGWKLTRPVKEMGNYSMLEDHEPGIGGGLGDEMGGGNRVSVYVSVDDPQRYLDKAVAAGAQMLMPVTTITPDTTIAMFRDPAGNVNGVLKTNARLSAQQRARRTTTAAVSRQGTGGERRRAAGRKSSTPRRPAKRAKRR